MTHEGIHEAELPVALLPLIDYELNAVALADPPIDMVAAFVVGHRDYQYSTVHLASSCGYFGRFDKHIIQNYGINVKFRAG